MRWALAWICFGIATGIAGLHWYQWQFWIVMVAAMLVAHVEREKGQQRTSHD